MRESPRELREGCRGDMQKALVIRLVFCPSPR